MPSPSGGAALSDASFSCSSITLVPFRLESGIRFRPRSLSPLPARVALTTPRTAKHCVRAMAIEPPRTHDAREPPAGAGLSGSGHCHTLLGAVREYSGSRVPLVTL